MNQAEQDLTMLAAQVANRAPMEWQAFVAGFKKYTDVKRDHVVNASLDELQKSQGRAQQCSQLSTLLEDAVKSAGRINTQAGSKPQHTQRGV